MNFTLLGFILTAVLFAGIMISISIGRGIGLRRFREEGKDMPKGFGTVAGAVFGLMGLVLAFTFSGTLTRFDARRARFLPDMKWPAGPNSARCTPPPTHWCFR